MSRIYSQADFQGVLEGEYSRRPYFAIRGSRLHAGFNGLLNQKILIAGCGWGYLVDELTSLGFTDVWGCDASTFAVQQAQIEVPAVASRILLGDCLIRSSMNSVRSAAGLPGNQQFRLVITEDLLPCMANVQEVQSCLTELRRIGLAIAHIITCYDPLFDAGTRQVNGGVYNIRNEEVRMPAFLWLTPEEWRAQLGSDWFIRTGAYELVP